MKQKKLCAECKKPFDLNPNKNKKYCSTSCEHKAQSRRTRAKNERVERIKAASRKRFLYKELSKGQYQFGSEFLTLKNYKEPLKPIPRSEGFGWFGTIAGTIDGSGIQCHLCGKVVTSLPGHLFHHKMSTSAYRKKYGLSKSSALVSENERMKLKQRFLEYIKGLTPEQKEEWKRKMIENGKRGKKMIEEGKVDMSHPISLETKNKRGTCPDQLLDKIREVQKKLGKTPTKKEFINHFDTQRYFHLIMKTYGSWKNALHILGLEPPAPFKMVKGTRARIYSDDEILDSLRIYAQENNRIPTESDYRRGMIPVSSEVLKRRFGGYEQARQLAGVYDFIDPETLRKFKKNFKEDRARVANL